MKENNAVTIYGVVTIYLLFIANLLNIIWTIWLTIEQIKTGWGYGTNLEIGVLWPWTTELLCIPLIIVGIVYFIIHFFNYSYKKIYIVNVVLFSILLLEFQLLLLLLLLF